MNINSKKITTTFLINSNKNVRIPIKIDAGLFKDSLITGKDLIPGETVTRALIIIDELVWGKFGAIIQNWSKITFNDAELLSIFSDETSKSVNTLMRLLDRVHDFYPNRRSEPIIAIGGGALLDVVGLAASLYRRGIPYVRIPTTLLGNVDAAVGIKTGINFKGMRNRIGTYAAPSSVFIDTLFLSTLDQRQLSSGFGEILKLAIIYDPILFEMIENHGHDLILNNFQSEYLAKDVIARCVNGMVEILSDDLWETVLSRSLDFGHTFSPLIEMREGGRLLHGEAVILDVLLCSAIALNRNYLNINDFNRIINTVMAVKLPIFDKEFFKTEILYDALYETTTHRNGKQNVPIPSGIGKCVFMNDINKKDISIAISTIKNLKENN